MDMLVYGCIVVLSGFIIWMLWQFKKEWPNYSKKKDV
jgi:hypothetical protein